MNTNLGHFFRLTRGLTRPTCSGVRFGAPQHAPTFKKRLNFGQAMAH